MRFVIANAIFFTVLSGVLFYQYFFQAPSGIIPANSSRTPAATPASLPVPLSLRVLAEKSQSELDWKFDLTCSDSQKEVIQAKNFLILNLKKCTKEFPKQIIIENVTNGFTASVFALNDNRSKTDSIPLKKGKNEIVIKYVVPKNKARPESEVTERISVQHN